MGCGPLGRRLLCSGLLKGGRMVLTNPRARLGGVYGAQELHELVADHVGGFVLYPVAHIVEFEPAHETGKTGAHLVHGKRIEFFQSIRLPPNEKGGLSDLRAFESGGQIEIRFGRAVVVQAAVKAGALEFRDDMIDVIWFRP